MNRDNSHKTTNLFSKMRSDKKEETIINKHSVQQYYKTLLNKNSFNKNFLNSEPIWGKQSEGSLSLSEKISLIKEEAS